MGEANHTLLAIDDDPEDRLIYRDLLANTGTGIDVREADSCREAARWRQARRLRGTR